MNKSIFFPVLAAWLLALPQAAVAQATQDGVANRLAHIEKLLLHSSGARQVADSASTPALDKRQQALDAYERARREFERGGYQAASDSLQQASRLMFEAIRLSAAGSVARDHALDGYGQRRESVIALRDAFNRISDENRETEVRSKVNDQLDGLIEMADSLVGQGDSARARVEIDKAYHLLKVTIESIRSGQTLVRSLEFADAHEEYLYEIDRNDTHSMLIGLLVDQKQKSDYLRQQIDEFVAQAQLLRRQAEAYADDEAWPQAIELLEQSTRQLVRAIRSAGIYIPG